MKRILTILGCWIIASSPVLVWADVLKLKDGQTLEGEILEENDTQIVFRVEHAGGAITRRDMISRSNIVEVIRSTEEEKRQRSIQKDFEALKRHQLNASNSFPVVQYDQIISNFFCQHLTQYPDSPYRKEIEDRIQIWQAERDIVAVGKVKYQGKWMDAAEGARRMLEDRIRKQLDGIKVLAAAGKFESAVQQAQTIDESIGDPLLVAEARRLESDLYQMWLRNCAQTRTYLSKEINDVQEQVTQLKTAKTNAKTTSKKEKDVQRIGTSGTAYMTKLADQKIKMAEDQLKRLQAQLKQLDGQITDLNTRLATKNGTAKESPTVMPPNMPTSAVAVAVSASVTTLLPSSAVLTSNHSVAPVSAPSGEGSLQWLRESWYFILAGALVFLWWLLRMMGR